MLAWFGIIKTGLPIPLFLEQTFTKILQITDPPAVPLDMSEKNRIHNLGVVNVMLGDIRFGRKNSIFMLCG